MQRGPASVRAGCVCGGSGDEPSRFVAVLALACAFTLLALPGLQSTAAQAQEAILCGQPLARHLAAAHADLYRYSTQPGTVISVEARDTFGTIGFIRIREPTLSPKPDSCEGDLEFTSPGTGMLEVSNSCGSPLAGDYTLTYTVVSQSSDSCAVPLPCGSPLTGKRIEVPGEVDSYTFPGVEGDQATVSLSDVTRTILPPRLRIFDPAGALVSGGDNNCESGSLGVTLRKTGTHTVLVSTCEPETADYTITWRPQPSRCTPTAPQGQFAYVANADSATVSVVDLTTNRVRGAIPIAVPAQSEVAVPMMDIAITPNGGFAYVTYAASSTVSVINTTTNLLVASIPVGLNATAIAITADGALAYVTANDLGGLAVIDTKKNQVAEIFPLSIGAADNIVLTPDGRFAYLLSQALEGVAAVDLHNWQTEPPSVQVTPGQYTALAISPNGAFVYAGSFSGIVVIDTSSNTPVATITFNGSEPFDIAFSPNGSVAYASVPDDSLLAVINASAHQVTRTIPVGVDPGGVTVSSDGALVYVTDFTAGPADEGFHVIDAASEKVVRDSPTLGDGPSAVALTAAPPGLCVGDADGETKVTIDEIITAVNYALNECPGRFPMTVAPVP